MELTPNAVYKVNHSSGLIRWRYVRTKIYDGLHAGGNYLPIRRSTTRYYGINLATGREVVLKSKVKVKCELESPHGTEAGRGNYLSDK